MKKITLIVLFVVCGWNMGYAQNNSKDTLRDNTISMVDRIYKKILPMLENVEFIGNSSTSRELQSRWNIMVNGLKNNSGSMTNDVKNLLVSPSGKPIDLELLQRFIQINEKDSVKSVNINMDFLLDEMKIAADKITNAAKKIAETK